MAFDAANNLPPSRSYMQKSVSLRDWWLTKPRTDDDTNALGVAGLTFTSQQNRAERCFSSAPILKVYDFFELETVDGVCIILQGYINKDRTLKSGFSSEVFDHFVIGFPPYWEEFSTSCPKRGYAAECVLKVNEDGKDPIEGHDKLLLHGSSYNVDMGVENREDKVLSNKTSTIHDASSVEVPHEHIIKAGDDPSLMGNNVECTKHNVIRKYPLSKTLIIDDVCSSQVSKCLEVSSRRMTRSMTKTQECLVHDLDKATVVDSEKLRGFGIQRKDANDALSNNKAVNVVDCDGTNLLNVGNVTEDQRIKSNVDAECLVNATFGCVNDDIVLSRTNMNKRDKDKEAIMTRSKSNRKLTSEMAKRQCIPTPKSTSRLGLRHSANKGSAQRYVGANILSPESFSGKRSRSGRMLLPSLEFWRNQTVLYDADRQVAGVQDGTYVPLSSRSIFH